MMFSKDTLVSILVIIMLVAGGAYYLRQQSSKPTPSTPFLTPTITPTSTATHTTTSTPTETPTPTQTPTTSISSDRYLFIEYQTHIRGELIEGNYPGKMIDFPTYSFYPENRTLEGWMNFAINDSLKVIYGSGTSLSGAAGSGAASMLSGVYELPHEDEKLKILKVDSDGTAHLEYNSLPITLKSGEEWTNITTRVDVQQFDSNKGTAKLTITEKIMNHGFVNRSNLINTQR